MHPQVHEPKPGECPFCGMDLTPVRRASKAEAGPAVEYWTCSMHPQVREPKPGECPFCGMDLTPVRAAPGKGTAAVSASAEIHLDADAIRQAGVRTEKVARRKLSREITLFGSIGDDLNRRREVVSLVEGRVERQWIDFNQTEVAKGAALVSLYSAEAMGLQEEYLKALRERWLSTFYERDLLGAAVKIAGEKLRRLGFTEADLRQLERERAPRNEIVLRAPIDGAIVENLARLGEVVKAGQTLYRLAPLDEVWFNARVFEPDLGALRPGQTIRVTTKADPGRAHLGRLIYIGRSLDETNRTASVRFALANPERALLPNMSASGTAEIPLGDAVLSVPTSAVLDLGTRRLVYVQKEEQVFVAREVRVGQSSARDIEIVEGLAEGETVVVAGAFLVDAQAQLRGSGGGMNSHDPASH